MPIRLYDPADFTALVSLWEAANIESMRRYSAEELAQKVKSHDCALYVAIDKSEIVGSIMIGFDGIQGWVHALAITPDRQNSPIGKELLHFAECWMKARNVEICRILLSEDDATLPALYNDMGYQLQSTKVMERKIGSEKIDMAPGMIEIIITYLEITERPVRAPAPQPMGNFALLRLDHPSNGFYRYLYVLIGERWLWNDRLRMSDEELAAAIDPKIADIFVLYGNGEPIGFTEIGRAQMPEIEIRYFGLAPNFIGRGLGRYLLDWTIDYCWSLAPKRVIVQTCTLDHPRALGNYQRAGFQPYRQEKKQILDPRLEGIIPVKLSP